MIPSQTRIRGSFLAIRQVDAFIILLQGRLCLLGQCSGLSYTVYWQCMATKSWPIILLESNKGKDELDEWLSRLGMFCLHDDGRYVTFGMVHFGPRSK